MKFALGTVQLGMAYGIANKIGQPSREDALEILKKAYEHGIKVYDTAVTYGTSEDRLGEFVSRYNLNGTVEISSKVRIYLGIREKNIARQMSDNIKSSLENLFVDQIDYYLLQNAEEMFRSGRRIIDAFVEQKESGLVRKIGVSASNIEEVTECLKYKEIDVVQLPFNVLDNRLIEKDLLQELADRAIEVHARNVYLQGLLAMEGELPEHLAKAQGYISWLAHIANQELHMELKELAFLYVRDNPYISKMFLGCESVEQLLENIEYNKKPALDSGVIKYLSDRFKDVPEDILTPIII